MPERQGVFYDRLEVRSVSDRDRSMLTALPGFLQQSIENSPAVEAQLESVDANAIDSFERLAELPIRRKSDLIDQQRDAAPFGGLNGTPIERLAKIFISPGPIFEPEGVRSDYWRFARAMFAAGFRPGDLVFHEPHRSG